MTSMAFRQITDISGQRLFSDMPCIRENFSSYNTRCPNDDMFQGYISSGSSDDSHGLYECEADPGAVGDSGYDAVRLGHFLHSPSLQIDGLRYGREQPDPHSPICMVRLPDNFLEPTYIRRRNERERERVRCVNEGYDKLKDHLPLEKKDRRISKVETLRAAIRYIRQLEKLLQEAGIETRSNKTSSVGLARAQANIRCNSFTAVDSDS